MNQEPGNRERKPRRLQAALVLGTLAVVGTLGTAAIYKKAETDAKRRADQEIVRRNVPCELTGEATATSGGAGFALKAQCPEGTAHVPPTLSLWTRMIDAVPSEKRKVHCVVRKDGSFTDCRKTDELASREERARGR
jgi:hypothetical protein